MVRVPPTAERNWYTAKEVAQSAGVSDEKVYSAARKGTIVAIKVPAGSKTLWRFPKATYDALSPLDLASLLQSRTVRITVDPFVPSMEEVASLRTQLHQEQIKWALSEQHSANLEREIAQLKRVIRGLQATVAEAIRDDIGLDTAQP